MMTQLPITTLTPAELRAELLATFPGLSVKCLAEAGHANFGPGLRVSGEAKIGEDRIFTWTECPDPDLYDGRVLVAFEQWMEARGYWLECYDLGVYFALPLNDAGAA